MSLLIYLLPPQLRLGYSVIQAGVRRGLTKIQIRNTLRRAGIEDFDINDLSKAVDELRTVEREGAKIANVPVKEVIDVERLPYAATNIKRRYSYRIKATVVTEQGLRLERYIQFTTDNPDLTPQNLHDEAVSIFQGEGSSGGALSVEDVQVEFGMQRAPDNVLS